MLNCIELFAAVRAAIDYDGMWRRREWFERDGISGYRLSPADAMLAHAFGLAKDEFSSDFNRYVDFYLLLQRYQDPLDECVTRAKAWHIERPLFGALHVTVAMFPGARTAVVDRTMDALLDRPTRQFLVDRILPDPATRAGRCSIRTAHAASAQVCANRPAVAQGRFCRILNLHQRARPCVGMARAQKRCEHSLPIHGPVALHGNSAERFAGTAI